ncbi:calmodulin-binding protein 60 C-like isoform X2 [Cucumis melo var. makuwa]|uniref:Calmodulin-binding protein 60 C-like isoform X2 n=2 Tax=Cucumis melo TaxID=3656 RepID=A0A5A7UBM7_CUCMM|nr:calmodulin-binding protein 60 B-like isoform X2 [Cucumis melo]KAA0050939.1 calmodulin-binding protein 60 C-like isoform X2 [Cucumis melo var. makuwa]TYK10286.1 calmodulin-binding protein 60 C-like isoform X2 [Cucumis melo var. makuwa]
MVQKSNSIPYGFAVGSAGSLSPKSMAFFENVFRSIVREEVDAQLKAHSVDVEEGKKVGGGGGGGESGGTNENLRLRLTNKIPSIIYTSNDIEAENGEELRVELFDVVNDRIIDVTHPLSSAWIEIVVLDGELFDHGEAINHLDFDTSVVAQRPEEGPWLVGDDKRFRLQNGVYSITNLSFTRNTFRSRTKKIRLGLRIIYDSNNNYPTIRPAVSNSFRVMDHRSQLNKKHHTPRGEDEVWRLKGIGRNGKYQKRLTSRGILNVEAFVKAYQKDSRSLRKLLGNRLSDRKWKTMVEQALQYVPITIPTFHPPNVQENLEQNAGMDQNEAVFNQNIYASNGNYEFQDQTVLDNFQDSLFI